MVNKLNFNNSGEVFTFTGDLLNMVSNSNYHREKFDIIGKIYDL